MSKKLLMILKCQLFMAKRVNLIFNSIITLRQKELDNYLVIFSLCRICSMAGLKLIAVSIFLLAFTAYRYLHHPNIGDSGCGHQFYMS